MAKKDPPKKRASRSKPSRKKAEAALRSKKEEDKMEEEEEEEAFDDDDDEDDKPLLADWEHSEAKKIIMDDLKGKRISRDYSDKPSPLWESRYKHLPAFKDVPKRQFCTNLRSCRLQFAKYHRRAAADAAALEHDLKIHQARKVNDNGEPKFADSAAQKLLREYVKEKKHVGIKPKDLWKRHKRFQKFDLHIFRQRIYQEERYQRFVNYLEYKREKAVEDHKEKLAKQKRKIEQEAIAKKKKEEEKKKKAEKEAKKEAKKAGKRKKK